MRVPLLFLFLLPVTIFAQPDPCHLAEGNDLNERQHERYQRFLSSGGDYAAVRYSMALAYARIGNEQKALQTLEQALADAPWLDPGLQNEFKGMRRCQRFQSLVQRVRRKYPSRNPGRVAFTLADKELIPEGLAAGPDGSLYLSSIYRRKILKISPTGMVSDFVHEAQDGLLGVLGIKVEDRDGSVWAASTRAGQSALFHFDKNGQTLGKYSPEESGKHLFNDLVITPAGEVFVTDSEDGSVYRLPAKGEKLVRIDLRGLLYPNGIALDADSGTIYVAHAFGIAILNARTGDIRELPTAPGTSTAGADGLYFRKSKLIAIQGGYGGDRIVEIQLGANGKSVTSGRLLEYRSSTLQSPTTGAVYGNSLYYIVNSQIDHEDEGRLKNPMELKPVKIAVLSLK